MDLFEAIRNRRSVRQMKTTPLPAGALDTILEAGRLAPSWANTQCWQLVVIQAPDLKAALVEELSRVPNRATEAVRNAPVTIAVCAETGKAGFYKGVAATDKGEYWYMFDTALIVENMCLAATALGLGSVIIGLYDHKRVAQLLGLPQSTVSVCLLPIGYPDDDTTRPRTPRKPLSEFVFRDRYGVKYG